jgi:hypothetical protein
MRNHFTKIARLGSALFAASSSGYELSANMRFGWMDTEWGRETSSSPQLVVWKAVGLEKSDKFGLAYSCMQFSNTTKDFLSTMVSGTMDEKIVIRDTMWRSPLESIRNEVKFHQVHASYEHSFKLTEKFSLLAGIKLGGSWGNRKTSYKYREDIIFVRPPDLYFKANYKVRYSGELELGAAYAFTPAFSLRASVVGSFIDAQIGEYGSPKDPTGILVSSGVSYRF